MSLKSWLVEKLNPAQEDIAQAEGDEIRSTNTKITSILNAYEKIDVVNRGINLLVDSAAGIDIDIGDRLKHGNIPQAKAPRPAKLLNLLNYSPNPYICADVFRRNLFIDLLTDGNAFMYWDGAFLYNLPAAEVTILTDSVTFIQGYKYENKTFTPDEVIHVRDNSAKSIYRGDSRLVAAMPSINMLHSMTSFQTNFFDNNAIPGIILKSTSVLSKKIKDRKIQEWVSQYNPRRGGKRPMIIDGDMSIETLGEKNFKELDFSSSIDIHEKKILETIGIPPVLLDSGNNANITPNLKLFYITTVLPLYRKYITALEVFFGYDLKENKQDILALRPELNEQANYLSTLVNAGILTRNEVRVDLRKPKAQEEFADALILPVNVAGSAVNSFAGGKPKDEGDK